MGNCLRGSFSDNIAKNSLDALLMQHQLRDTHELASFAELDNDSIRAIDQTTINLNLLERIKNLEDNVQSLSEDLHLIHQNFMSNHQSSSK
jgi:hypothetical protein